eukprot:1289150-Pyramimonas_sp.AAC.1
MKLPLGQRSAVLGGGNAVLSGQCGVSKWASGTHSDGPTGRFGGVSYEATTRCNECENATSGFWDACGRWHWGL